MIGALASTNSFTSVDPKMYWDQAGIVNAWGSSAYTEWWGQWGALVWNGGGHGNYFGNEVVVYDFDDLTFKRLNDPHPNAEPDSKPPAKRVLEFGEFADDGTPLSHHNYDNLVILPPSLGGGKKGSLLRVVSCALSWEGVHDTYWSHAFDLDSLKWQRFSKNSLQYTPNTGIGVWPKSAFDAKRSRAWWISYGASQPSRVAWLDLKDRTHAFMLCPQLPATTVDSGCWGFHDERDLVVALWQLAANNENVISYMPASEPRSGFKHAKLSEKLPAVGYHADGIDYCPLNRRLYAYLRSDVHATYEITVPAKLTETWSVVRRPFEGFDTERLVGKIGQIYKKWIWCSKIGCFALYPTAREGLPMLVYRPPET